MFSLDLGKFWGAVFIALPLFMRVGLAAPGRFSKDSLFFASVVISVMLFGLQRVRGFGVVLACLAALAFINQDDFTSARVIYQFAGLSLGSILFLQFFSLKLSDIRTIEKCLAISCVIQSVFVLINVLFNYHLYSEIIGVLFSAKSTYTGGNIPPVGTLGNPNVSSSFIALTLPFLIYNYPYGAPIAVIALFSTGSAMAIASILLAVCLSAPYRLVKVGSVSLAIIIGFMRPDLFSGRLEIWENGLKFSTFWGRGVGFIADNYRKYFTHELPVAQLHNEYLEYWIAFGVPGVILLVLFLRHVKIQSIELHYKIAALTCLIGSVGHFIFHLSSTAMISIFIFAVILRGNQCHALGTARS